MVYNDQLVLAYALTFFTFHRLTALAGVHNGCSNLNASETASGFERFKHVGHWQFVHLETEMTIRDNRPVRG